MNDKNNYNELTVQDIRKFLNTLKAPEENLKALKEASKSFEVSAKKDELKLALSINVDNKIVDKILQLLLSSMIILNCFNINADFTLFKYENNVTNYYIDHSVYIEELNYTDEDIEDDSSSE